MTQYELNHRYFNWLCRLVCDTKHPYSRYSSLLEHLHNVQFEYILDMDENRLMDGIDMRYRFGRENRYPDSMIATLLDDRPCSILEMMVALAVRCEEHIMEDPDIGDRTGHWFWVMVHSLGLESMRDEMYNSDFVDLTLERFLNRTYAHDGQGGLFTVKGCQEDMRDIEIWYQLNMYLNTII